MDAEEYVLVTGLLLMVLAFLLPGQLVKGTFCDGSYGKLGVYTVSVSNGYLKVSAGTGDVLLVHGDKVLLRRADIKYRYSSETGCYTLAVRQKREISLYGFVLGAVLAGGAVFYMLFLKYR
ncbi:hypothetical protein [Thermococcus pacificus]|uniref:Uncharacterized protein n=1 Tax=Thermococcus pacificus TaxID=71998 RepID=A0A218P8K2_9EURY|nr:hypothetical protein [Thermococcus pacificus]ASJ07113.1 hypothetical protein A3L08_07145 [Thermococcus pacificus]